MLELGISQAQAQFTKILNQAVLIVDKKSHQKKAIILPYEEYHRLVQSAITKEELKEGGFNQYVGLLNADFESDDPKYQAIVK
jgi:hypothetical protein